jgi:hypothetical protein
MVFEKLLGWLEIGMNLASVGLETALTSLKALNHNGQWFKLKNQDWPA